MKILIVLSSRDPEIKYNAVRLGNYMLNEEHDVTIYLNGSSVDLLEGSSKRFPVDEEAKRFALSDGVFAA